VKRLVGLFALSLLLGCGGLYLATRESIFSPATYAAAELRTDLAVVSVLSLVLLWIAPVAKIQALVGAQGHRLGPWEAFTAHVGQVFGSAMTPSGTGGAPGLVLALERSGVPLGTSVGVAVQLFVLDLAALGVLIPVGLVYIVAVSPLALPPFVTALAIAAAALALVGAIVLARFPGALYGVMRRATRWRPLRRFRDRLARMGREYYVSAVAFRDLPLTRFAYLHGVNIVGWLANFILLWALLATYGAQARLLDVLSVLSIISLVGFFVPTPGASGFTELMVGLVVDSSADAASIAAPVALWRAGTFYVAYLLGPLCAWLLLSRRPPRWLRRPARRAVRGDGADPAVSRTPRP
jgi:uncharacterized protein (TIRG00374 family)